MVEALAAQASSTLTGIVAGTTDPPAQVHGFRYFRGGHPLPTAESFSAARAILRYVSGQPENALMIFLISGGGSAAVEFPIDETISHLKGKARMNAKDLFGGFSEEEQEKMAEEAAQRWDSDTVRASNRRWNAYPPEEKKRILNEGNALFGDLVSVRAKGASSKEVQAVMARWHAHQRHFWSPSDEELLGLADLYNDDPRFRANYEKLETGLAEFMREAIKIYVKNRKK